MPWPRHHGLEVLETPVGFKFIGEYIRDDRILIGGEESAGLTVRGHVPDKDGILACLLVAEMVAVRGQAPDQAARMSSIERVGEFHTRRENLRLTPELEEALPAKLACAAEGAGRQEGRPKVITIDGAKFLFDDGTWVLFRKSGTEPVVRVYAEGRSDRELETLIQAADAFIRG